MINDISLFDCTIRESGYQTGWHFEKNSYVTGISYWLKQGLTIWS